MGWCGRFDDAWCSHPECEMETSMTTESKKPRTTEVGQGSSCFSGQEDSTALDDLVWDDTLRQALRGVLIPYGVEGDEGPDVLGEIIRTVGKRAQVLNAGADQ